MLVYKNCLSFGRSGYLIKGVTKTIKNETKSQSGGFLSVLLGTLGASLLGDILSKSLTNFEIKEYYKNESGFNGVYSRDNLPKTIKYGAYVINLGEYADVGTFWIALYVKNNEVIYFYSFGVEHIPKEIKRFIRHKSIKTNIFRIQADNSIMCGYFCIGFFDFMFASRSLIDYTSLFSPYDFKNNDKIILLILNELVFHISSVLGHDLHT